MRPLINRVIVVFPQPLRPQRTTHSPFCIVKLIFRMLCAFSGALSYWKVTCFNSIIPSPVAAITKENRINRKSCVRSLISSMQVRLVSASSPRGEGSRRQLVRNRSGWHQQRHHRIFQRHHWLCQHRTHRNANPPKTHGVPDTVHSSEIVGMKRNITDKGMISLFGRCIRSKESINSLTEVVFISSIPAIKIGSISLPSLTREKKTVLQSRRWLLTTVSSPTEA